MAQERTPSPLPSSEMCHEQKAALWKHGPLMVGNVSQGEVQPQNRHAAELHFQKTQMCSSEDMIQLLVLALLMMVCTGREVFSLLFSCSSKP